MRCSFFRSGRHSNSLLGKHTTYLTCSFLLSYEIERKQRKYLDPKPLTVLINYVSKGALDS